MSDNVMDAPVFKRAGDLDPGDMIDGAEVLDWLERDGFDVDPESWMAAEHVLWTVLEVDFGLLSPGLVGVDTLDGGGWRLPADLELTVTREGE